MSLIGLLIVIAIVGLICWALITYVPMPAPFKGVIVVVALLVLLLAILQGFGGLGLTGLRIH